MTIGVLSSAPRAPRLAWAVLAGPAVIGGLLGAPMGLEATWACAASLPMIFVGLAVMLLPALYIAAAFVGVAPTAHETCAAAGRSLRGMGMLLLGLAPALAFTVATSTTATTVLLLGHFIVALTALLGLRHLYLALFEGALGGRALPLYLLWSLTVLGSGLRWFEGLFVS